jgi:large subunit ribosomal protein L21
MFAILETGGKQYKVEPGDLLEIEVVNSKEIQKDRINFSTVLLINNDKEVHIGAPYIKNGNIQAKVVETFKSEKIIVFKKKPKEQYKRKRGHRQNLLKIQIEKIEIRSEKPTPKSAKPKAETTKKATAKKTQPKKEEGKSTRAKTTQTKKENK